MQSDNLETTIHLTEVGTHEMKGNAFIFLPPLNRETLPAMACFAHGYTSHKGSLLNWGSRLVEWGVPTLLLDLPGHHLGGFNSVPSFATFKSHAHELFLDAFAKLKNCFLRKFPLDEHKMEEREVQLIFGGHSLGSLLSLKAMELPQFASYKKVGIAVGLGMSFTSGNKTHLFETDFYRKTLNIRQQLVVPELHPDLVFPWIKEEKEKLFLQNQNVYLLTGEDDVVSPAKSVELLEQKLLQQGNQVTFFVSKRLSHHQPELAAPHICDFLKSQGILPAP